MRFTLTLQMTCKTMTLPRWAPVVNLHNNSLGVTAMDQVQNMPAWVTNIYTPEGNDRMGHNPPTSSSGHPADGEEVATVAELVSRANKLSNNVQ